MFKIKRNNSKNKEEEIKVLKRKLDIANNELAYYKKELHYKTQELNSLKRNLEYDYLNKLYKLKNINIAYVLAGFPTLSQSFVLNELRWLKEKGVNVKVFSYGDPEKYVKLDFYLEVIRFDDSEDLMTNLETLLLKHDIDLIHTHFIWPACTKFTYPVAEKLKVPFTVFAHAFDIFIHDIKEKNNLSNIANSKYCKGIFTLGNFHKNYLVQQGVPTNKVVITKQASDYEINSTLKRSNQIKKVISISRFVEKKGIDTIIDAAKLLENENLDFYIYGFGDLKRDYINKINELNLHNVHIKGSLNGFNEVKNVFENSDLLVSPCKRAKNGDMDGIPTIIFEAMAYGVPIITTNVSAIPEVIINNKNGFIIEPNSPELLALKIKEVMRLSPNKLFKIRQNAKQDVQNISSVDKTMNVLVDCWTNIFNHF